MTIRTLFAAALVTAAFAITPATAAVTFDYAQVNDSAYASVTIAKEDGGYNTVGGPDYSTDQGTDLLAGPFNSSASYLALLAGASASQSSSTTLSFTSAAEGLFTFAGSAVASVTAPDTSSGSQSSASTYRNYYYQNYYNFTLTTPSTIDLTFTATGYNTYFGTDDSNTGNYFYIASLDGNGFNSGGEYVQGTTTRSLTLQSGQYQLTAAGNNGYYYNNYLSQSGIGVQRAQFDGTVGFLITPSAVPEPASWAMMIGGVGMLGGVARRRRHARATLARA